MKPLPQIDPMPAVVGGHVPWVGTAPGLLRDPTGWFTKQRVDHERVTVSLALGHRFFCVFGAAGVQQLYAQ